MTSVCLTEIGIDPEVKSYRILIRTPIFNEKTNAGLYLPDDARFYEQKTINIGKVLKIGELCFRTDATKAFEVKEGDWIVYSKYERESLIVPRREGVPEILCYFINDDRILARLSNSDLKQLISNGA